MAVAEARKMEKGEERGGGTPGWSSGALGWFPRKIAQLRTFFVEVWSELKKVTWPSRSEVYATTIVVLMTTVFFGFYLFGLDFAFSKLMELILK